MAKAIFGRSPLASARGLGSAKEGVSHWWVQRVSALILIPLMLWFTFSLISKLDANLAQMSAWVASPLNAALLVMTMVVMCYHSMLGLQVVIEDYISDEKTKILMLVLSKGVLSLIAISSVVSILIIALK